MTVPFPWKAFSLRNIGAISQDPSRDQQTAQRTAAQRDTAQHGQPAGTAAAGARLSEQVERKPWGRFPSVSASS